MIYHRCEARFQTPEDAETQVETLEIWGRGAFGGGGIPCVKAYPGTIDAGARGIEFETGLAPSKFSAPNKSLWYLGYTPGVEARTRDGEDFACICVDEVRNHQARAA